MRDVECAICTETYRDPHMLGCGHSFCFICISSFGQVHPACPTCRQVSTMKPIKNFTLIHLLDTFKKEREKRSACPSCDSFEVRSKFFFCETDSMTVCSHCTIQKHKSHAFVCIDEYKTKMVKATGQKQLDLCLSSLSLTEIKLKENMKEENHILEAFPLICQLSTLAIDKYVKDFPENRLQEQTSWELIREMEDSHSSEEFQNLLCDASTQASVLTGLSYQIFDILKKSFINRNVLETVSSVRKEIRSQLGPDLGLINSFCSLSQGLTDSFAETSPDKFRSYDWPWTILRKYKILGPGPRTVLFSWHERESDIPHKTICDKEYCKDDSSLESFKVFFVLAPESGQDIVFESAQDDKSEEEAPKNNNIPAVVEID